MSSQRLPDRRHFFGKVARGFAAGAAASALGYPGGVVAADSLEAQTPTEPGAIRVSQDLFAQYQQFLLQRVAKTKQTIADSVVKPGARPVTLGVYQMRNHCDGPQGKQRNLDSMLRAINTAHKHGVQVLVFPEMCLPGYFTPLEGTAQDAVKASQALADTPGHSRYLQTLCRSAAQAGTVIVFGFCEKSGDRYFNAAGVVDADGAWLGLRRKNPLYPYEHETQPFAQPPRQQRAAVFPTKFGKVGVSICFDGDFPESIREMRLEGAEMLLWSNAALGDSKFGTTQRQNSAGFHAQTNALWVACCNCAAPNSSGMSCIYSPFGEPLAILPPDEEAIATATIDLKLTSDWSIWKDRLVPQVSPQQNG